MADSARMLARTTYTQLIVCDKNLNRGLNTLFDPQTIRPGASCIEMDLPEPDPKGELFEQNLLRTAKLLKVLRNLPALTPDNRLSA